MKKQDLIAKVAAEMEIPKGQARKMVDFVLMSLVDNALKGEEFASPIVKIIPKTIPARSVYDPSTGQTNDLPERQQVILRPTKKYLETIAS